MKFLLKLTGVGISGGFAYLSVLDWENFFIFTMFISAVSLYRIVSNHWIADIEKDFFCMILAYIATYLAIVILQGLNI